MPIAMMTMNAMMKRIMMGLALAGSCAAGVPAATAYAWQRGDQPQVLNPGHRHGPLPLPVIERRVRPQMGGASYLGPEFDSDSGNYRLKFMQQGAVIWVDVDGRSGNIIRKSGR